MSETKTAIDIEDKRESVFGLLNDPAAQLLQLRKHQLNFMPVAYLFLSKGLAKKIPSLHCCNNDVYVLPTDDTFMVHKKKKEIRGRFAAIVCYKRSYRQTLKSSEIKHYFDLGGGKGGLLQLRSTFSFEN